MGLEVQCTDADNSARSETVVPDVGTEVAVPVNAELRRKNQAGELVDYVLVDDAENPETGLADPAVDFGARARLDVIAERLSDMGGLVPTEYDQINLSYTGDDLTGVVYRSSGTVVATLTLSYTDGRLTGVART